MARAAARDLALSDVVATILRPKGLLLPIRQVLSTNVLILVVNVGTGLITARLLGPAGRGELTALTLWPGFTAALFTFGLPRAITFNLSREQGDASCLVLLGLLMTFCIGSIAAALGALVIPIWLQEHSTRIVTFAQWAMLVTPVGLLMLFVNGIQQSRGTFAFYNLNKCLPPLLTLIGLVGLASFGRLNPFTAALAFLGSMLPLLAANLIWIARTYPPRFSEPGQSLRRLFSYGLRCYGTDVAGRLSNELDRVLLVGLLSPAALGIYVVARSLSQPALSLPNAVVAVLFPAASRADDKHGVALVIRAAWVTTAISCVLALGMAVFAPALLKLLYGNAFAPAVGPFRILVVDTVLAGFGWILMQGLMSAGRPGLVTVGLALGLITLVLSLLLLIPALGTSGAALAVLISSAVRLMFILCCFPLVLNVRVLSLVPPRAWSGPRGADAL